MDYCLMDNWIAIHYYFVILINYCLLLFHGLVVSIPFGLFLYGSFRKYSSILMNCFFEGFLFYDCLLYTWYINCCRLDHLFIYCRQIDFTLVCIDCYFTNHLQNHCLGVLSFRLLSYALLCIDFCLITVCFRLVFKLLFDILIFVEIIYF